MLGFTKELLSNVQSRFPGGGTYVSERCVANYIDPAWKGVHLMNLGKLEDTKQLIKGRWAQLELEGRREEIDEEQLPLSPTSKLLKQLGERQSDQATGSLAREMRLYEDKLRLERWRPAGLVER